jgi:hypothetical protein
MMRSKIVGLSRTIGRANFSTGTPSTLSKHSFLDTNKLSIVPTICDKLQTITYDQYKNNKISFDDALLSKSYSYVMKFLHNNFVVSPSGIYNNGLVNSFGLVLLKNGVEDMLEGTDDATAGESCVVEFVGLDFFKEHKNDLEVYLKHIESLQKKKLFEEW